LARLTRSESQARTRHCLLQAAADLFRRDGYAITSVEKIAEAAGFTKGAVYSNFDSKEAIFLEVLGHEARENVMQLIAALDCAEGRDAVIDVLADWASDRCRNGGWSLSVLEHARSTAPGSESSRELEAIVRECWLALGHYLKDRFPGVRAGAEMLGALLFEIAYAPALTFLATPTAGDLIRLVLPHQLGFADEPAGAALID